MRYEKKYTKRPSYLTPNKTRKVEGEQAMKRVALVHNQKDLSVEYAEKFKRSLSAYGLVLTQDRDQVDYVVSIGGDGTLLSAFHQFQSHLDQVQFLGIHTGHLGFYTDWLVEDLPELLSGLKDHQAESIAYPLLDVKVFMTNGQVEHKLALNECSIRSHRKTMVCDVEISGQFFETFRGDGLCVATPTGSTGLNKSLGGAVIHPRVEAMQMTEMASVNNRVYRTLASPIILPKDEWLNLRPEVDNEWLDLTVDHLFWADQAIDHIRLQLADQKIKFANFRHMHYWDRVESAFIASQTSKDCQ